MKEKEKECDNCGNIYPTEEIQYYETIMMDLCDDCLSRLIDEYEYTQEKAVEKEVKV